MKKALRIISISAGIVSAISAIILGCIYLKDIVRHIKKVKTSFISKMNDKKYIGEAYEYECG